MSQMSAGPERAVIAKYLRWFASSENTKLQEQIERQGTMRSYYQGRYDALCEAVEFVEDDEHHKPPFSEVKETPR